MQPQPQVALVNMPFQAHDVPSIALGILKASLAEVEIASKVYDFTFELLPFLHDDMLEAAAIYSEFSKDWLMCGAEWLFSPRTDPADDEAYYQWLRHSPHRIEDIDEIEPALRQLRETIWDYVAAVADEILAGGHDVVGFTASYLQTQASMAVAARIKELRPETHIVLGGASAHGVMGAAILRSYPQLTAVCHSEAETIIEPLVRSLRGQPDFRIDDVPGVSYRTADGTVVDRSANHPPLPAMDDVPLPDYTDYFARLEDFGRRHPHNLTLPRVIMVETSRGCWWGATSHCTFCGLNGERMAFRSKSPDAAVHAVLELHDRHGIDAFLAVDNIIDHKYFDTVCTRLARERPGLRIFYEVKSNLRRHQVRKLADAGIDRVQPGFESLSTPVLRLMRKGVTAIQNVQSLRWLTEDGVTTLWNHLYGFPQETLEDVAHLPDLIPRLAHLAPPNITPVAVQRFSPHQVSPERFGIRIKGPYPSWRLAFANVSEHELADLCYMFEWDEPDRDPRVDPFFTAEVKPLLRAWHQRHASDGCSLRVVHGPDESVVLMGPEKAPTRHLLLTGQAARILRYVDRIRPRDRAIAAFEEDALLDDGSVETLNLRQYRWYREGLAEDGASVEVLPLVRSPAEVLDVFFEEGLTMREGNRVLALPVDVTRLMRAQVLQDRPEEQLAFLLGVEMPMPAVQV